MCVSITCQISNLKIKINDEETRITDYTRNNYLNDGQDRYLAKNSGMLNINYIILNKKISEHIRKCFISLTNFTFL